MSSTQNFDIHPNGKKETYVLPDLLSMCPFKFSYHPEGNRIALESAKWMKDGCPELSASARAKFDGLYAGSLSAFCYPTCSTNQLRVIGDFLNFFFHLDDISDGLLKRDSDALAEIVLNALHHPKEYVPLVKDGQAEPISEPSVSRLARE